MDNLFYSIAVVILILLSGFFSATETAYSSISRVRFKSLADSKSKRVKCMVALGENYEKLLSTILIGNNIVNIGAATLATLLFTNVMKDSSSGASLSTLITTIVILFVGEVGPKTLAKKNPESMAISAAPIVLILFYLFYPLNWVLGLWQKLLSKMFKSSNNNQITDEELITYVDEAQSGGGIDEYEGELIRSAIEFDDLTVEDALTSRVDIEALEINTPVEKALDIFKNTGFSRLPIYKGNIDNIVGVLNEKDFYKAYLAGEKKIRNIMAKDIIMIPPSMKIADLLRKLQKGKMHLAIVISEFGGTMGIITLEDILEELVGEIWDEHDEVVEPIRQVSDDQWEFEGDVSLEDFFETFDIEADEDDYDPVTVSGFVSMLLERVPKVNDVVKFENLVITVRKVEFNRAVKIFVKVLPKEEEKEENNLLIRGFVGSNDDDESEDK